MMVPPLLALLVWPLVSILLFRKQPLPLAILVTLLGGFLLLPERTELDLPAVPSLDKHTIPSLTALVLALIFRDRVNPIDGPKHFVPRHPTIVILLVALVAATAMTALTNRDVLVYGETILPHLRPYDAVSMAAAAVLMILPMLLARRFLATPESHRLLLLVLCGAALCYSLPTLFEVRMSPQLHSWVYGFFQHSFLQHMRAGGFRPIVFLPHGLVLGIFLCLSILATVTLARFDARRRVLFLLAALWLVGTLILSRNLGALFITAALLPVVFFLGVRAQLLAAAIISGLFLIYPVVRTSDILPLEQISRFAQVIDVQRAESFQFRLDNEEQLIAKAFERPLFGWGGWDRSRVFDAAGSDISVTDGAWIITLGTSGWVGYIAVYGLLTLPIFLLFLRRRQHAVGLETAALAVILAANLVDLIPNSSNTPLTWLLAGALWGRLEWQGASRPSTKAAVVATSRSAYARSVEPSHSTEPEQTPALSQQQSPYSRQQTRIERKRPIQTSKPR
jgi:hypothetical protein